MSDFQYTSLQAGEIRLLSFIWPKAAAAQPAHASPDTIVSCNLENFSISACPPFDALSYTWGEEDGSVPIEVNGATKLVRRNLAAFLRQMRPTAPASLPQSGNTNNQPDGGDPGHGVGYVWIDALCIDQTNIPERNAQVALMRDIYAASKRIIIWLGEDDEDYTGRLALETYTTYSVEHRATYVVPEWDELPIEIPAKPTRAIGTLGKNEWWSRSWIVQEATTPGVPKELWCGDARAALEDAEFVHDLLWQFARYQQAMFRPWENQALNYLRKISKLRSQGVKMGEPKTEGMNAAGPEGTRDEKGIALRRRNGNILLSLLVQGRSFKASDPRDKVYAFLGIYRDAAGLDELPVPLDYALSVAEIYREATLYILDQARDLGILLQCSSYRKQPDMPSWVPDFSVPYEQFAFFLRAPYRAGTDHGPCCRLRDNQFLCIRGSQFDIITETVPALHDVETTFTPREIDGVITSDEFSHWVGAIARLGFCGGMTSNDPYVGGSTMEGAMISLFQGLPKPFGMEGPALLFGLPYEDLAKGGTMKEWMMTYEGDLMDEGCMAVAAGIVSGRRTMHAGFRTEMGYIGCGDAGVQSGDVVALVYGLGVPMILRGEGNFWRIVGPCYVAGIMDGEATKTGRVAEDFELH